MRVFINFILVVIFTCNSLSAVPKEFFSNWKNPTHEDLRSLQNYLKEKFSKSNSSDYSLLASRIKTLKIFDKNRDNYELHIRPGTAFDKACCVICYVSINSCYERRLARLLDSLQKSNFSGDVLYRIGGWPNMEDGGILLSDTPYAFKITAFEETFRLGYKQVLWLDSSVIVLKDLDIIFQKIREKGAYFKEGSTSFNKENIIRESLAQALGMPLEEVKSIPHYMAGVVGLDLENPVILQLLKDWHTLAEGKESFKSQFPEEVPFSFLVDKYHLHGSSRDSEEICFSCENITKNTIFFIKYHM